MKDEDGIVSIVESELPATPNRVAQTAEGLLHETYEIGCPEESTYSPRTRTRTGITLCDAD